MKFIVSKAVEKKSHETNCYELHVTSMSGDADHYETNTRCFTDLTGELKVLEEYLKFFDAFCQLDWNTQCDLQDGRLFDRFLLGLKLDLCSDALCDLIGDDITTREFMASPDEIWVTYWDGAGIEYEVRKEDGTPMKWHR